MPHADVDRMLALVRERTGYPVSVISDPKLTTHSAMASASSDMPGHVVRINPKHERHGNYLVALQCAMLLVKWADPKRIPDFCVADEKADYFMRKFSQKIMKLGMQEAQAGVFARDIVTGLLMQLNSIPCQIRVMELCRELCPSLGDEQQAQSSTDIREMSRLFSEIRAQMPAEVYDRSITMNAALVRRYSQMFGDTVALLPYESLGYTKKGDELLAALDSIPKDSPSWYPDAVNAWGRLLHMDTWYSFKFRAG